MSRRTKMLSMRELYEVFQTRNERIFGKRTQLDYEEPPQNACTKPSRKREESRKDACTSFHRTQEPPKAACTSSDKIKKPPKIACTSSHNIEKPSKIACTSSHNIEKPSKIACTSPPHKIEKPPKVACTSPHKIERPSKVASTSSYKTQEPPKDACTSSHKIEESVKVARTPACEKHRDKLPSFKNSKKNSSRLPAFNEQQIVQSRSGLVPVDFLCRQTMQPQISQVTQAQDPRRKAQQGRRVIKPVIVKRVSDDADDTKNRRGTTIQDERATRKPCLERRPLRRVVITRPGCNQLVRPRRTTCKYNTIGEDHKPRRALTQHGSSERKQSMVGHKAITKQQQMARDDHMKPRIRTVATVDQATQQRSVACHETNDVQRTDRRVGLCAQTDPAQQQLMFIRVLRKRF